MIINLFICKMWGPSLLYSGSHGSIHLCSECIVCTRHSSKHDPFCLKILYLRQTHIFSSTIFPSFLFSSFFFFFLIKNMRKWGMGKLRNILKASQIESHRVTVWRLTTSFSLSFKPHNRTPYTLAYVKDKI